MKDHEKTTMALCGAANASILFDGLSVTFHPTVPCRCFVPHITEFYRQLVAVPSGMEPTEVFWALVPIVTCSACQGAFDRLTQVVDMHRR